LAHLFGIRKAAGACAGICVAAVENGTADSSALDMFPADAYGGGDNFIGGEDGSCLRPRRAMEQCQVGFAAGLNPAMEAGRQKTLRCSNGLIFHG